ncbi:MAG: methyltransferase domain-containing protein [Bacteroidetes bacterium]|nr:MAG: methyltransferase domain-containing protein [Bacteroidota bacterium]
MKSPIEKRNILFDKKTPLNVKEKKMFTYFGINAKIKPPLRILNPHRIIIGDRTSIQEYCHINAFEDLSFLKDYISTKYKNDFNDNDYLYDSKIEIGNENQIGRFFFVSCTNHVLLEDNVLISERVFIGDNNHSFSHPHVPVMQQPNKKGTPIMIKRGSWIGVGAVILPGTQIGSFSVVGANSVCKGVFPDYSVIATEHAKLLYHHFSHDSSPEHKSGNFQKNIAETTKNTDISSAYSKYYSLQKSDCVYPVEFVIRSFLGKYPHLNLDKSKFEGSRILDLGYGDGRNMPLLYNLGFKIYGVEISEEINRLAHTRLEKLGISAILKTGRNASIPFDNNFFQYVLACHSCYYVEEGMTFNDNLREIYRVLSPNGIFICSLPIHDTYILDGAKRLSEGHYRITKDPYNLRNGTIFCAFKNKNEIMGTLDKYFHNFSIGFCDDDFYGIHQKVWIVVCQKK